LKKNCKKADPFLGLEGTFLGLVGTFLTLVDTFLFNEDVRASVEDPFFDKIERFLGLVEQSNVRRRTKKSQR